MYGGRDISHLFRESMLDVYAIREALKRNPDARSIEGMYQNIVKDAVNFESWGHEQLLRNAVLLATMLKIHNLKTNQIRRILEIANQIHLKLKTKKAENIEADLIKMRYLLAYAVARASHRERGIEYLHKILEPMLK